MLTYNPPTTKTIGVYDDEDELFNDAVKLVTEMGVASASVIQRHFKIGYARAARLLDELEDKGIVGPVKGAKPREILVAPEDMTGLPSKEELANKQFNNNNQL